MKRLVTTFASAALVVIYGASVSAAPLALSQQPLFIATAAKPNVLLVLANSNSMDEDAERPRGRQRITDEQVGDRAQRREEPRRELHEHAQHGPDGVPAAHDRRRSGAALSSPQQPV